MSEIAEWVLNKCALSKPPQTYDSNTAQFNEVYIPDESDIPDERVAPDNPQNIVEETDFGGRLEHLLSTEGDYYTLMCTFNNTAHFMTFSCSLVISIWPIPHACELAYGQPIASIEFSITL